MTQHPLRHAQKHSTSSQDPDARHTLYIDVKIRNGGDEAETEKPDDVRQAQVRQTDYAEKDEPQPHVLFVFGLENLNPDP
jgi:hypothetical protein